MLLWSVTDACGPTKYIIEPNMSLIEALFEIYTSPHHWVRIESITLVLELFKSMKNIGDRALSRGDEFGLDELCDLCREVQHSRSVPDSRLVAPTVVCFALSLVFISFLHFVLRFWNHVLTWVSVSLSRCESSARFSSVRYFLDWNSFSSVWTWCWLKRGRCFFLRKGRLFLLQLGL